MQPTLMVIDDDANARAVLCDRLSAFGYPVAHASRHGITASARAEALRPEIIFVAIEEPIARSMLTIDFIRDAHPGCVIVGYTSVLSPALTRRVMRSDVSNLLESPLSKADVQQAMGDAVRALERKQRTSDASHGEARGNVIAVVGQKGGIGKTTLATNLASVVASRTPASTIIIDLDTRFGDVALAMDVPYEFSVANAARGFASLDREEFRNLLVRHESGAYVLPSPESPRDWVDIQPQNISALVDFVADMFDYVILDTPGTLDETVAVAIEKATHVVTVTSLDLTSIKNTNLLLEYYESEGVDPASVLIAVSHNLEHNVVGAADVAATLERPVDIEIPFDRDIAQGTQTGRPVTVARAHSAGAHAYARLAGLVSGETITMPTAPVRGGLLGWLVGRKPSYAEVATMEPIRMPEDRPMATAATH